MAYFERERLLQLQAWKQRDGRKPMLLDGARQVGKTWLMKEFGRTCFVHTAYINFDEQNYADIFATKNPQYIVQQLSLVVGFPIQPADTLLIFDEIQECTEALNALKYFCEQMPEQAIMAAGSLPGVSMAQGKSFPVGKVEHLTLYPLTFREYLHTADAPMCEYLDTLPLDSHISEVLEQRVCQHFNMYRISGGMPAAAAVMAEKQDIGVVDSILDDILTDYRLDFSKHSTSALIPRIGHIYNSIPSQLAKENRKFIYRLVRPGARAREYEDALLWLQQAGLIYRVHRNKTPQQPLSAYDDLGVFKVYLSDIGLLCRLAKMPASAILSDSDVLGFKEFKGALAENYVLQSLSHQTDVPLRYWTSDYAAEVDFIIQYDTHIIPIEVKAGKNIGGRSLTLYNDTYHPVLRLRYSSRDLHKDGNLLNIPLFMTDWTHNLLTKMI